MDFISTPKSIELTVTVPKTKKADADKYLMKLTLAPGKENNYSFQYDVGELVRKWNALFAEQITDVEIHEIHRMKKSETEETT